MMSNNESIDETYSKAYKEVITVLKTLPLNDFEKIPKDMIDMFESNMSKDYDFEFDIDKSYEEQSFMDETEAIIYNIYRDYLATDEEKTAMKAMQKVNSELSEIEKEKKYSSTDIFKNEKISEEKNTEEIVSSELPTQIKKESLFVRFINFIKNIFNKK